LLIDAMYTSTCGVDDVLPLRTVPVYARQFWATKGTGKLRQHTNAFDLVRLIAAGLVLWSHQHALMGLPEPSIQALQASVGGLGLYIFFAVSGYLNTLSLAQHRSVRVFLLNRVLRIYPALAACVLFTVILGLFVTTDLPA
jgi:peptidoglycan/LPS O-acetylase OafA/YrhL